MKKKLGISACLMLCLLGDPASGVGRRAGVAELGSKSGGGISARSSWARRAQRTRRAPPSKKCTPDLRDLKIPLPTKTYTGTVRYSAADMDGSATLEIRDDQTFDLAMRDD